MNSKIGWTGRIAYYFLENGKLTSILMVGLFLWGIFSFIQTPKKYNPTIVAPAFKVRVDYPGASREEVLEQVVKPLENVISDIAGVEDIFSYTFQGGGTEIFVNFYVGEDLDSSKVALNDRLQSDWATAPKGIKSPLVESLDPEDVPIMSIALSSDSLNPIELRKLGFQVKDQLSDVSGISRLNVTGGKRRELRIEVDPHKLTKYAITVQQIEKALKENNVYFPSGFIKGESRYSEVQTSAWVTNPKEVEEIIVVTNDTINLKVKDLARVYETIEESESIVRHTKKKEYANTVMISLAKLRGTNISDVSHSVVKELDRIKNDFLPNSVNAELIVNDGKTASDEIGSLMSNLFTSIIIVILVLFLFLNVRASILVAISIPLTLCAVFGVAYLAGQDINRITLFALILSLGLLVDNATVVIENIIRQVELEKETTLDTFARAVDEVGSGLFMATVTTVLAFLPMKFISGMMGPYMGPIPFFLPAALIAALIISYSINPWLASVLIKGSSYHAKATDHPSKWEQLGTKISVTYRTTIRHLMTSPKKGKVFLTMIFLVLIFLCSFPIFQWVKFRMLPKANVDQFFVYVDLPYGSSLEQTNEVAKRVEESLKKNSEVTMVQSYIGTPPILDFNGLFKGVQSRRLPHQATLRVGLLPDSERDLTSEELVLKIRKELNLSVQNDEGVKLKLIEDPPGPPVLSTFLVRLQSKDISLIENESKALLPLLKDIEGTVDHDISSPRVTTDIKVTIDHLACSRSRVTPGQVVDTINAFYSGRVVGIYHREELYEQEYLVIRVERDLRKDDQLLENMMVQNGLRNNIPLSQIAKVEMVKSTPMLIRENHQNTVYLTSEMGDRSVTYAGIDLLLKLIDYKLSDGNGKLVSWNLFGAHYKTSKNEDIDITIGGEWELTLEVFRDLMIAMGIAILAIYLVLVGQFKSFGDALLIMSTIPLSIIGIMPGFAILNILVGEYFTATSMIGVIALAGIAVNNAIIMLEYINQIKESQDSLVEVLVEAASTRLRPIALTTITTVLGSLTIISDPVWSGLAWSIVLGLGVSSTLIMFVFPLLYFFVHRKRI